MTNTHFRWDLRHWPTVEAFAKHLSLHDPSIASWAEGVVIHHTWRPTEDTWNGPVTMTAIKNYYHKQLGWDSGPHLFLAVGSKNPNHDGIWQMTALNETGIHAGYTWNRKSWGIEVVGNFDLKPWSPEQQELVYGVTLSLLRWRGIVPSINSVIGHREAPSKKTCPGSRVDMNKVRCDLVSRY